MNTFQDEILKQSRGNAYHLPIDDGYQDKISSLDPPKFKPNNRFGEDSNKYKALKSGGASLGYVNLGTHLQLLKDTKLGKAIPGLNILTGSYDALNEDNSTRDRLAGGARATGGVTGLLGLIGAIPKAGALASASVTNGAFSAGGALASGSSALASGGAVLGAGATGYGVGKLLNLMVGGVTSVTGIADKIDKKKGIKREEGKGKGYDLSDLASEAIVGLDRKMTGNDENGNLNYKKTMGYRIAEYMSEIKGPQEEKETKELS
jgi:hypothetical protein